MANRAVYRPCEFAVILLLLLTAEPAWPETGSNSSAIYRFNFEDGRYFIGRVNMVTRDGFSDPFFGFIDANIGHRLNDAWSFSAGYRHAYLELNSGARQEYRPQLDLEYQRETASGKFHNRARLEFRYFEGSADDHRRFRNQLVWTAPFKLFDPRIRPYISEEFFYQFTDSGFNLNWLTLGLRYSLAKNVKLSIGYRWQARKSAGDWSGDHLFVTGISVVNNHF